ncbi:dinitrogenase iron-molybdenum cofactor biosynthesis protein [Verrucomicrobia bacterium S94]|nr:dinitrogenase iron-molybdenum cofactor biosynthesis protein [Verrucomicrobia bacterium S94]
MKIAISTSGENLSAPVDTRFGRAPRFLIYDTETGTFSLKENKQNLNAAQGAGIQSAACVCEEQVDAVITGNCGPKAFAVLDAAGVKVFTCENTVVSKAVEQLRKGELQPAEEANVEGHWV